MERVTFSTPTLFADHHVLTVRKILLDIKGVDTVIASPMYRDVTVDFDPAKTSSDEIHQAIEAAGYPIGVEPELQDLVPAYEDGSLWHTKLQRVTNTNMTDKEMSGDFRNY